MTPKAMSRLLCGTIITLFAAGSDVGAQTVSRTGEDLTKPYLKAQQLVVVEGHRRLNLYCIGQGRPTVLFDGGGGASTAVWRFVQGEIGKKTGACSYDRAGFGFSDPPNGPADARTAVEDIHRLLKAVQIAGPVIYVGHSLAGLFGVLLQATYPKDVAAEVLVDPSFADQDFASLAELPAAKSKSWLAPDYDFVASMKGCAEKTGALPKDCLLSQSDPKPSEVALGALDRRQASQRSYLKTQISEYESFLPRQGTRNKSVDQEQVEQARPRFGNKPLVILTRDGSPKYWKTGHDKLVSLSTEGHDIVVPGSTHSMLNEMPRPVIAAVVGMVEKVRH